MRPPSPSVVAALGTRPNSVFVVPVTLTRVTRKSSRSVTRACWRPGIQQMSHGMVHPVVTVVGVWSVPRPQALVVKLTVLLGAEVLPAASRATTCRLCAEPQGKPVTVVVVAGGLPVTVKTTPLLLLRTLYAVTPLLSVDAPHARLTLVWPTLENVRLVGALLGRGVSGSRGELGAIVEDVVRHDADVVGRRAPRQGQAGVHDVAAHRLAGRGRPDRVGRDADP